MELTTDKEIKNFGKNLTNLRKERELTFNALSKECGISVYMLRNFEKATITPRAGVGHLYILARYFDISMVKLFE